MYTDEIMGKDATDKRLKKIFSEIDADNRCY
jgi:hypothetical protein